MQIRGTAENQIALPTDASFTRALRWFLVPPMTALALIILGLALLMASYESQHNNVIYTGVQIWGLDLSKMTPAEAENTLNEVFPQSASKSITLVAPGSDKEWTFTLAELGISYDVERTVENAYSVGRTKNPLQAIYDRFTSWYFGRSLAPVIVFDEGQLEEVLNGVAAEVNRPAQNAQVQFEGEQFQYSAGRMGRRLDIADMKRRLMKPVMDFRSAEVELLVHEVRPHVLDDAETADRVQAILGSPMVLYFKEPLEDLDLHRAEVSSEQLAKWVRVRMVEDEQGARYEVFVDENAVRNWLTEIESRIFRRPENARFYFDDNTEELVLVEPHVVGRALDVEATLERFMAQVDTPNRSVPFVVTEIVPTVHSQVTAEELGITELVTESTTWFYGSTPERKHNIARAAAQFYGVVVAPGEEFSFNRYLGDVTEEAGFTTGLIIIGGRLIEGIGGGVCQVSTTLYQAAFWAGYPITERLEHGYRIHYYDDGEGPGMDATVYTPDPGSNNPGVDLKFVNNTEHYLLIENYYNETYESLTFKFYSTNTGRTVEKEGPFFENERPPTPPVWEYDENLEQGEIVQIDWAVEGADVTVFRRVYDANGSLMYGNEAFRSHYVPWSDIYHYGPGVDPENVDPDDMPE